MPNASVSINTDDALNRFVEITQIPGISGEELDVANAIIGILKAAGVPQDWIQFDDAHTKTRIEGNCGNLIVSMPGNGQGTRTMLSAHMDTVPICVGSVPAVGSEEVTSSADTGLGADDRSGCAAILSALIERFKQGDENFSPAVVCFLIQEEIGLEGARNLDRDLVGKVDQAFNFDNASPDQIIIGAIGGERMSITLTGVPAHAGVAPETGCSAIVMASKAIAELHDSGWLGKIENEHGVGTANVGVIQGGDATNVITPQVMLRAEARSHDASMRTRIVKEIESAFSHAAASVQTNTGVSGQVEFESHVDYESFKLDDDHPSIAMAKRAVQACSREPECDIANGGLDANWLFRHGISAVTLGCGQRNIHTADERLVISDYLDACRIATDLITSI